MTFGSLVIEGFPTHLPALVLKRFVSRGYPFLLAQEVDLIPHVLCT